MKATPNDLHVLRIDASAWADNPLSHRLGDAVLQRLAAGGRRLAVTHRDLAAGIDLLDHAWLQAAQVEPEMRSAAQRDALALSETLVGELQAADVVVITAPMYNFSVPAALKAWIDLVARARVTFRYTADGPEGLLADRPVYLAMTSGGVPFGSALDFASPYLRHVLGFIGLHDLRFIGAAATNSAAAAARDEALRQLDRWLPGADEQAVA